MADWTLTLYEDRLGRGDAPSLELGPSNRVLYVHDGGIVVREGPSTTKVGQGSAWHGSQGCLVVGEDEGAHVLRYELSRDAPEAAAGEPGGGASSRRLLAHAIALDPGEQYLMRCDRVDFAPGGEALPHGHKGGGIRWLIAGALEVRIAGRPGRLMKPGHAWFESGVEPVHALASNDEATSFVRVSILPRAVRGQSSIVYVDPAHASVKPRRYTVYVDAPIEIA